MEIRRVREAKRGEGREERTHERAEESVDDRKEDKDHSANGKLYFRLDNSLKDDG
jgi:hypothetical protein